jgi:hypothetical protein
MKLLEGKVALVTGASRESVEASQKYLLNMAQKWPLPFYHRLRKDLN